MSTLRILCDSGLPTSFTTVIYGWRCGYLTREELISYAMDQIGYCQPQVEGLVSDLAFADPTDIWTIERIASDLDADVPEAQEVAARCWRVLLLDGLTADLTAYLERMRAVPLVGADVDDLQGHLYCSFGDFWRDQGMQEPAELFQSADNRVGSLAQDGVIDYWLEVVANHRKWAGIQREELLKLRR